MSGEVGVDKVNPWRPRGRFTHVLTNDAQLERMNAEGGIAVTLRPLREKVTHLALQGAQNDALCVWRTKSRTGFISSPCMEADVLTIRFVLDGRMIRRDAAEEHVARRGHAMLVVFERMRDEEASPAFEALSATMAKATLLQASRRLEGDDANALTGLVPVVEIDSRPMQYLLQTLLTIHSRVTEGANEMDLVLPLMQEVAAYQLLTSWPRIGPGEVRRAVSTGTRVVRRAKDYIEAHLSRRLMLADVAEAAGVGVRGLQVAFRKEAGMSPSQFIMGQRLARARADLRASTERGASIRSIAERWGFTHMGDFSRRYRARFGETPTASRQSKG